MTGEVSERMESRVLLLAPAGKDATILRSILANLDVDTVICSGVEALAHEAGAGAGCIMVAEEALADGRASLLHALLARQPAWSDLPLIVLTRHGADSPTVLEAVGTLGNVTVLERPARVAALVSAVRTALRARRRQYQIRSHLQEREQTAEALREADRRKDEFLATLAHELRNPLAPIHNSIRILRLHATDKPESDHICEMMERQVAHMVRLVDDLLEVSRITRGKVELLKTRSQVATAVQSAVESSLPLIEANGQELDVSLPHEPLWLDADPVRLTQVFVNLLNNAAKYTDPGGRIRIAARRQDADVVVSVTDTGVGIPASMLDRVFDMFTQVHDMPPRAQGGLGIGLTLVRNLVELHGGSVVASSAGAGKGSEFTVRLPLVGAGATVSRDVHAAPDAVSGQRILVVDDNRDAADSLGMLLRLLGAETNTVHDGPAALAAVAQHMPDVVLLDLGMPHMDGFEVARRIRALPGGDAPVLVALTGWGQEEDRRRTRLAGFDHHFVKPLHLDTLRNVLAMAKSHTPERRRL